MALIQYSEQGIFVDFIEPEKLVQTLEYRIKFLQGLIQNKDRILLSDGLGVYNGKFTFNDYKYIAEKRIDLLQKRLIGYKSKHKE